MNREQCLQVLELPANASHEDTVTAYRLLVQVWHPDRFANKPELCAKANAKLAAINEAYTTLTDGRELPVEDFTPYRDEQVKYSGTDPRVKASKHSISASVEVTQEGLTLAMFNGTRHDEFVYYPRNTLVAAETKKSRWVSTGVTSPRPASLPRVVTPEVVRFEFADPEGILRDPILVVLSFRNSYFTELFLKKFHLTTGWELLAKPAATASRATKPVSTSPIATGVGNQTTPHPVSDQAGIPTATLVAVVGILTLGAIVGAVIFAKI